MTANTGSCADRQPEPGHGVSTGEGLRRRYPTEHARPWRMRDGSRVMIRPIRPSDERLLLGFHQTLSDRTVYMRYFGQLKLRSRIAPARLAKVCAAEYKNGMVLVVEWRPFRYKAPQIIGVGRLSRISGAREAEVAVVIADNYHGLGLGSELLRRLARIARDYDIERIVACILSENHAFQHIFRKLAPQIDWKVEEGVITATVSVADIEVRDD